MAKESGGTHGRQGMNTSKTVPTGGGPFNLVEEKWIPVLYHDGRCARVGIRRAMEEAGGIRQIAASNPMDRMALLRFLLAVLYWLRGNPARQEEKTRVLANGHFPVEWLDKLGKYRDCFNLMGKKSRFYQDSGAKRQRAVTDLFQEIPTGNNFWHFRHSTDGRDGLCISCCAMGLLRLPLFSVSGLPDLKAGINGTPPIYVFPVGVSLLQTLCLNWIDRGPLGLPSWEEPKPDYKKGSPVPFLIGLTMLSRRVWLHAPNSGKSYCIGCGRESPLIQVCEYQSAGPLQNNDWDDPHIIYVQKKTRDGAIEKHPLTAPDLTKSYFRMDKPWSSLFMDSNAVTKFRGDFETVQLLVVGFATDKAKNVDVWERRCAIPPATEMPGDTAVDSMAQWNEEGKKLAVRLKPNGSNSHGLEFVAATTAIRPHVEVQVSSRITELLAHPERSWVRAVEEYRQMISIVASPLAPGSTSRALVRRHEITTTLPNMTPIVKSSEAKTKAMGGP